MRILSLILLFSCAAAFATQRYAKYPNQETIQGAIDISLPSLNYVVDDPITSTDPFSAKTNKYAESSNILVISETDGFYINMSASTGAAGVALAQSASSVYVPKDQYQVFIVNPAAKYVRVINASASAVVHLTELY